VAARRILARESPQPPHEPAVAVPASPRVTAEMGDEPLQGRYRLLRKLGSGGFGVVWLAYDEQLRREVAVKRIPLGPEGDAERATREAQAAARLSHPAIVALYEAFAGEDAFYLISELVTGSTLGCLIATGELDDEQVFEVGLALCAALAHAHSRGVVHRDIKPQNVLVPEPGDVRVGSHERAAAAKLTDFGGASLMGEEALTRTGDVLGTLAYMAPEQSEGREVGAEADLYALALVLYEALSGHNPVRGATTAATARRIGTQLEPLRRYRPDLSAELAEAVDIALSPHPSDRGELDDLRAALSDDRTAITRRQRRSRRFQRASPPQAELRPLARLAPRTASALPQPALAEPEGTLEAPIEVLQPAQAEVARGVGIPRIACLAGALLLAGWEAAAGRGGLALLALAALLPLQAFPLARGSSRLGLSFFAAALAPLLGLVSLAGAFPALAGQPRRWGERLALGMLGYWWLVLAEPLLGRRLWLGAPALTPPRSVWEGSIDTTAVHVIGPLLSSGVLLGGLLWAVAALAMPLLVRGRSAARDLLGAVVWSAAVAAFAPQLDAGLRAAAHPSGRGAVLGAVVGGLAAVGARALRGPV
jgi:eukaryotic-like serine/threonine-protein kinase